MFKILLGINLFQAVADSMADNYPPKKLISSSKNLNISTINDSMPQLYLWMICDALLD